MQDYALAKRCGYRLVYVFDANIVGFFLSPEHELHHIKSIAPERPSLRLTSLLTAEFLFSRRLAGQWGDAPYLAPSHAEDVASMLGKLRIKLSEIDLDAPAPPARDADAILRIIENLQRGAQPTHEILERIARILPEAVRPLVEQPALEARQFVRLHEQDLLRPLWLDRQLTEDIADPATAIIDAWTRRLRKTGRAVDQRTTRDAKTLAQIELLNAAMIEANEPVRYLFVSSDSFVQRAYHAWYWQADQPFFALRQPIQYLPMLNVEEMDNDIESSDLVAITRRTLDVCFASVESADERYPLVLPQLVEDADDSDSALFHDGPLAAEMLDELELRWAEAEDNAVALSADMLRHRKEYSLGPLRDVLASRHFKEVALDYQARLIGEVESHHLSLIAQSDLADIVARLEQVEVVGPRRAPLLMRADFSPFIEEQALDDVLESFHGELDRSSIRTLTDRIKKQPGALALLFTAMIAFRAGQWTTSGNLAARAKTAFAAEGALRDDAAHAHLEWDAAHLFCLAARFDGSIADVAGHIGSVVVDAIDACVEAGDHFGHCRALHDGAAGRIQTVVTARLRGIDLDQAYLAVLLDEASDLLSRIEDGVAVRDQGANDEDEAFSILAIQQSVSILNYVTAARLLGHGTRMSDAGIAAAVRTADKASQAALWPFPLTVKATIAWHAASYVDDPKLRQQRLVEVDHLHQEGERFSDRLHDIDTLLLAELARSAKGVHQDNVL